MKLLKILSVAVCFIALTQSMWGQKVNDAARPGIPGYLDPRTGTFRAILPTEESPDPNAAASVMGGTIVVNFTITVKSVLPSTDTIACGVNVIVIDVGRILSEEATVAATGTGGTRSCKVTIPYSWSLTTASTDMVQIGYTITAPGVFIATTNALPNRLSSQNPFVSIKVPLNGTMTTETVTATI